MASHQVSDASGYAFFGEARDDLLGELGGDGGEEEGELAAGVEDEVDISELMDDEDEHADLSFASLLAGGSRGGAGTAGSAGAGNGTAPRGGTQHVPLSAIPRPPMPPPQSQQPPSSGVRAPGGAARLSSLPPPPGFYGGSMAPPVVTPPQHAPAPRPAPPVVAQQRPRGAPLGTGAVMLTAAEVEARAMALMARQQHAQPPRAPGQLLTVADLEARLTGSTPSAAPPQQQATARPPPPPNAWAAPVAPPSMPPQQQAARHQGMMSSKQREQQRERRLAAVLRDGSERMTRAQIESILRIQWAATHPVDASPYVWDYYALAKTAAAGQPQIMQPSLPAQVPAVEETSSTGAGTSFVPLDGLGKIPWGNVRHPKPLLQLLTAAEEHVNREAEHNTSLEMDNRVALRGVIDDCYGMLSECDDVTRLLANGGDAKGRSPEQLVKRRAVLLEAVHGVLHLPPAPTAAAAPGARKSGNNDNVLAAMGGMSKGRTLLAQILECCIHVHGGSASKLSTAAASPHAVSAASAAAKIVFAIGRCMRFVFTPPKDALALPNDGAISVVIDNSYGRLATAFAAVLAAKCVPPSSLPIWLADLNSAGGLPDLDATTAHGAAAALVLTAVLDAAAGALAGSKSTPPSAAPFDASAWESAFTAFFASLSTRVAPAMRAASQTQAVGDASARNMAASAAAATLPAQLLLAAGRHAPAGQRDAVMQALHRMGLA